jgi:hypothetical protein
MTSLPNIAKLEPFIMWRLDVRKIVNSLVMNRYYDLEEECWNTPEKWKETWLSAFELDDLDRMHCGRRVAGKIIVRLPPEHQQACANLRAAGSTI